MPTRIKICGITRREDALAAASLGADAIGFVFYAGSPRCVRPEIAQEIVALLPPFVTTVGLFVNPTRAEVESVLGTVQLDLLQFHGAETPEFCGGFARPFIKALAMGPGVDLVQSEALFHRARGMLIDAYVPGEHGGTGVTANWDAIPQDLSLPLILAGGLNAGNVASAIAALKPWAVDVSSGVERAKGIKDHRKMAEFIEGVRNADV